MIPESRQQVIVGIIYNQTLDSVLISKRHSHKPQGGMWEFPGGKPLPDESEFKTLSREVEEETGLNVVNAHKIQVINYDYVDLKTTLNIWIVDTWTGKYASREGQIIKWCNVDDLRNYHFPEANKNILKILKLPILYLITPDFKNYNEKFFNTINRYLDNGLKLIQFRCPSLPIHDRIVVAERLRKICNQYQCLMIYNGSQNEAESIGADGVHFTSKNLMNYHPQKAAENFYLAASCHNNLELSQAKKCDLDFCVIGPVQNTVSHENSIPLGWENTSNLSKGVPFPVYALGGIKHSDVIKALNSGCYGISMISGVWDSDIGIEIIKKYGSRPSHMPNLS
jgi:8-oxo-dGTP diphosphatase